VTEREILSRNLRFIRYSMGLYKKEIAALLNISLSYYKDIEEKKTNITLKTLFKIASILKISPHILLENRDEFIFKNLPFHIRKKMREGDKTENHRVIKQLGIQQ